MNNRLIKSNDAGGGGCTNTVDLYNPFPDGGGVALYQLNGDANDVSGNYDGTDSNVTYGGAGVFGTSAAFSNGTNSKIILPIAESFFSTNSQSVSIWVKMSSLNSSGQVGGNYAFGQEGRWVIQVYQDVIKFSNFDDINRTQEVFYNATINLGQWYHIVAIKDKSSGMKIYVDNVLRDSNSYTTDIDTTNGVGMGYYESNSTRDGFNGSIDQVRIFGRALRPYEVEALYTEEYCTPTIVPSEHFNTVTYTGNGSTQSITGVGFQPDFTWIKVRTNTDNHILQDSVRGVGKGLFSDLTNAENASMGGMTSFDSDGFTFDGSISSLNYSARDFVSWNFKAGGAAVTNTDGTITSQVSANTEAGFSIVSYTGNETSGSTVGHGLSAAPQIIIVKELNVANNWQVYTSSTGATKFLYLNSTIEALTATNRWNDTSPESSVFTIGNSLGVNRNSSSFIAYCFAEVEGFSNFGSYVGTGASGNTVVTGFEPAMIIIKDVDTASYSWILLDNKREGTLYPDVSDAEYVSTGGSFDGRILVTANGFQLTTTTPSMNGNGVKYIYMAFAADPTTIEPSLEDSFNTVLYEGQNTDKQVTSVGFQPDLVWVKNRDDARNNVLSNSISGATNFLISNSTSAEITSDPQVLSLDIDGFTVIGDSASVNRSGFDFVAWCWKGAELPAINSNGSIPSVVSANPAAGFSIVSWTGNGSTSATIGHGLGDKPAMVITKMRAQNGGSSSTSQWIIYHKDLTGNTSGDNPYNLYFQTDAELDLTAFGSYDNITEDVIPVTRQSVSTAHNNNNLSTYIAYCFAEVAGFSKFGSYTGNGSTSGATINCGFEPAFVMIKSSSDAGVWIMHDNKRGNYNNGDIYARLQAESSGAEVDDYPTEKRIDISSTGFTITNASNSWNGSGRTYIYMAFANQF